MVMSTPAFRALACILLLGVVQANVLTTASATTPVAKVISLLKRLEAQIEEEGKKEAADYDKYACFCKEQADGKLYAIEKSDKKLEKLTAEISELEAAIADLEDEVKELSKRISELEGKIKSAKAKRKEENEAYEKEDADLAGALEALKEAIKVLQDSKSEMVDAKLNFAQISGVVDRALNVVSARRPTASLTSTASQVRSLIAALAAGGQPIEKQYATKHTYEYRSNDIIGTLQNLQKEFTASRKELYENEFELKAASEKKVLALSNEKKFAEKDKAEKEQVISEKSEELNAAKDDKEAETKDRDADQAFMDELTEACTKKAEAWDERSKTRSAELTAISEAVAALESGVAPNYGANKRLAGLQRQSAVAAKPVSLLQVGNEDLASAATNRAMGFLESEATRLGSAPLAGLMVKATALAGGDHFAKVTALIKGLIAKLEEEATAEAEQKSFCNKGMDEALTARDAGTLDVEDLKATISQKTAEMQEAQLTIQGLVESMAGLNKALLEATELRAGEKAENEKTLAEAAEGKEAVNLALGVLKEFYESKAFVQTRRGPAADREGKTLKDLAPEPEWKEDEEYKGKQEASKGIIGILEMILEDFERTEESVGEEESKAQEEFEKFEADTKADIEAKESEKDEQETAVATCKDDIQSAEDGLRNAEKGHAAALKELEKLKAMCVEGAMSWEERAKAREQEIEALKKAMQILEDWKA